MSNISTSPNYDSNGLHILDPKDTLGHKSEYITLLQEKALMRYLPKSHGIALDVGCGYGRLSSILQRQGWQTIGIDPDDVQLDYAKKYYPDIEFRVGKLPDIPVDEGSVELMMMHNMLRVLKLLDKLDYVKGCGKFVAPHGHLVVVDNIWKDNPNFLTEAWILNTFEKEGFKLQQRIPIRAGRWWLLYLIRYGLIPRRWFDSIAEYELRLCAKAVKFSKWRYFNVMYLFTKEDTKRK